VSKATVGRGRWRALAGSLALSVALASGVAGQAPGVDSTRSRSIASTRDAIAGVTALAGAFALDHAVRTAVQRGRSSVGDDVATLANTFGSPLYVVPPLAATYLVARLAHRPQLAATALRTGGAAVAAGLATVVVKEAVGRARPYQTPEADVVRPFSGFTSFPSGHTAIATAVAVSLAGGTNKWWAKALLYGGAGLTGLARINDDKHWLSDVVAGAAVGIVAGRLSQRWHRPQPLVIGPGVVGLRIGF